MAIIAVGHLKKCIQGSEEAPGDSFCQLASSLGGKDFGKQGREDWQALEGSGVWADFLPPPPASQVEGPPLLRNPSRYLGVQISLSLLLHLRIFLQTPNVMKHRNGSSLSPEPHDKHYLMKRKLEMLCECLRACLINKSSNIEYERIWPFHLVAMNYTAEKNRKKGQIREYLSFKHHLWLGSQCFILWISFYVF